MTSYIRRYSILLLVVAALAGLMAAPAQGQTITSINTYPTTVQPGQPFTLYINGYNLSSVGLVGITGPSYNNSYTPSTVSSTLITINSITLPTAGQYSVNLSNSSFPLTVGSGGSGNVTITCSPTAGPSVLNQYFYQTCMATPSGTYNWSVTNLPTGLGASNTVATGTVIISGYPNTQQSYNYTIQATNGSLTGSINVPGTVGGGNSGYNTTSISPSSVTAGSGNLPIAVFGNGFTPSSIIYFGNTALSTQYQSTMFLSATIPSSLLTTASTVTVYVLTNGQYTNGQTFTIGGNGGSGGVTITSISPTTTAANTGFNLTFYGSGFAASQGISIGTNTLQVPTGAGSSSFTVFVPANFIPTAGTYNISVAGSNQVQLTVTGAGGGTGITVNCTPTNGPSQLNVQFTQTCAASGGNGSYTWSVTGTQPTGFALTSTSGSVVNYTGTLAVSQYYSYAFQVTDTANHSGTSQTFTSNGSGNNNYNVTSISPQSVSAGSQAITLNVYGTGFTSTSVVTFNNLGLNTTVVSSTQLLASIPASYLATAQTAYIGVSTGGTLTNTVPFTIGTVSQGGNLTLFCSPGVGPSVVGTAYTANCSVSGGTQPYSWTTTGALPGYLALNANGATATITGTPNVNSSYNYFVKVTDSSSPVQSASLQYAGQTSGSSVGSAIVISSISPTSAAVGSSGVLLTVNGSGFSSSSLIYIDGTPLATNPVSANQLTAVIPAGQLNVAHSAQITVVTPGAGTSNAVTFQIGSGGAVQLTITCTPGVGPGSANVSYSQTCGVGGGTGPYTWQISNGTLPTGLTLTSNNQTSTISGTTTLNGPYFYELQVSDSASHSAIQDFAGSTAGGGGVPNGLNISAISPNSATIGSAAITITVTGTGFGSDAVVKFNGAPLSTFYVSSNQLNATIPAASLTTGQTAQITVTTGGQTSNSVAFTVGTSTSMTITCAPSAGPPIPGSTYSTTCTVTGGKAPYTWSVPPSGGFLPLGLVLSNSNTSTVTINGTTFSTGSYQYALQVTDSTSPTPLTASYPFAGSISNSQTGTITALNPIMATVGSGQLTLTVTGTGFQNGASIVYWNGSPLTTNFVSPTQLTAIVPASLMTNIGTAFVTVQAFGASTNSVGFFISGAGAVSVSPQSLTFTYALGGTLPAAQLLNVSSTTPSITGFTVTTSGQSWLVPNSSSGTIPGSVAISVAPAGYGIGTYNGSVTITGFGVNGGVTVPVTLNIVAAPSLVSAPKLLTFNTPAGSTAATQTVNITSNDNTTVIPYTVSATANNGGTWLSVQPNSGNTPGSFTVTANATNLAPSTYSGTITVTAGGNNPSQVAIPVSLTVTQAINLSVSPASLSFSGQVGGSNPPAQNITVSASNNATLNFNVATTTTSGGNWLTASPNGTAPGSVAVNANLANLAPGTYNGNVAITSTGASNSPQNVPVTLVVSPQPFTLSLSPATLTFNAQAGGTAPGTQTISVGASNNTAAGYTVTVNTASGGNWLSATPASGTTPGTINVSVNPSGLALGQYTGTVTVASNGATNTPQTVQVTLNVQGQASLFTVPGSLSFRIPGDGSAPAPQTITVVSSGANLPFTATAVSQGGNWLSVNNTSGTTPANLTVSVNPAGLTPGQSYNGSISITASSANPNNIQVPVTVTVAPQGAVPLQVTPSTLYLSYTQGSGTDLQRLIVTNLGGGTINFTATSQSQTPSCANWLSLVNASGAANASTPGIIGISVSPDSLTTQTCRGIITIADSNGNTTKVPVFMAISGSPQSILLSQTALNFQATAGGAAPPSQTFQVLNPGSGSMPWSASTSTLSGGSWLSAAPNNGSAANLGQPVSPVSVSVNPQGLAAGTYYGTVQVTSSAVANSPQSVTVVLTVLPLSANPSPQITPGGVIITGSGGNADTQTVTLTNPGGNVVSYSSAVITDDGQNWLMETPSSGSIPAGSTASISLTANVAGLSSGLRHATLRVAFSDGSVQTVDVQLAIAGSSGAGTTGIRGCAGSNLALAFLSPSQNFQASARVAVPLQVLVKDCNGNPLTSSSTGVDVVVGSTGADIRLNYVGNGIWSGTWTPSASVNVETLTAEAISLMAGGLASGTVTATGASASAPAGAPPYVSAVVNAASFLWPGLVAPGTMVSIFGSGLADGTVNIYSTPYPTTVQGAQFTLRGSPLPLFYTSDGQVNAVLPIGITPNVRDQIIAVRDNSTQSVPLDVLVADTDPGTFAVNQAGTGQGAILLGGTGQVVAPVGSIPGASTGPATAGQYVSIFMAGLGAVNNPPADGAPSSPANPSTTVGTPTVTIGGVSATVSYSGLAPGEVGLYQVNVQVPAGVPTGDAVPVIVTMGNGVSNTVTMAIK